MMYDHKNGCIFRKLRRSDLPDLLHLKDTSWTTTHHTAFLNDEDQQDWFDAIPANALHMACLRWDKQLPALLGLLSLTNIDTTARSASIGGAMFPEVRGSEWSRKAWEAGTDFAFEMLNLNRLDAEVVEYNLAALKFDVDLGYKIEGRRRRAVYKAGRYYDSIVLGLLRDEWESCDRVRAMGVCNRNFKERRLDSAIFHRLKIPTQFDFALGEG